MHPKRPNKPLKLNGHASGAQQRSDPSGATLSDRTTVVVNNTALQLKFNDLTYVRKLGSGQFATVHHMRVKRNDVVYDFAVKEIKISRSEMLKSRIRQESEFGIRMSVCPFAVITYGVMGRGDDVRILMEVMDSSVTNLCFKRDLAWLDMPEEHVAFITKCVVKGLDFLCQRDIQHRDVKPTNMLVNRSGFVKICDYGVAQKMEGDVTKTNVGTYKFLAPERLVGGRQEEGFRIQSDVWSLGVSVYNIVTSSIPFPENATIFDYHSYITANADVELPTDRPYSPELRTFVSSCLKVNEANRPNYTELLRLDFIANIKIKEHKPLFGEFPCSIKSHTHTPSSLSPPAVPLTTVVLKP
ncbi:Dual specificity mitogen-activated protein kinase kinase 6 [Echinococcus granulosus]|uniref:mitogen-activated protein kinase kinase n=1 Tax=Echinococcus granulosus TaxID=6210 RepID=A0A068WIV8_ECHGR|nr:Dual specificity mitogen-activated protein kinase kinase 6 [Echinococcus granulosus]CDS20024.1 dual specificity mitogen activated protein [Echinococcus granulosus]